MIEWKAVREAASRFLPKYTAAAVWKHRNLSHVEQEELAPMPKDRGAEQGDVDGPLECSLAQGWWRLKREDAWLLSRRQAAFRGLVLKTLQKHGACKQITQSDSPTSSWVAQKNSLEPKTRGMRCKKREAWRTCGTWTTVTFCVTRSWCRLTCRTSTSPMPKLEQSENLRERKSSVARTTWVQQLLSGDSVTCRAWPRSPQYPLGASHSKSSTVHRGPALGKDGRHSSPARTGPAVSGPRRQNLLSNVKVLASVASNTFCECTATRSCKSNELLKSMTSWDSDLSRGSFPGFTEDSTVLATLSAGQRETSRL